MVDEVKTRSQSKKRNIHTLSTTPQVEKLQQSLKLAKDIIDTIHEPFLVLDPDLRVVKANPAFYHTFKVLKKNTEGTLIYQLGNNQWQIPELRRLLESILLKHTTFKGFEVTHDFSNYWTKNYAFKCPPN